MGAASISDIGSKFAETLSGGLVAKRYLDGIDLAGSKSFGEAAEVPLAQSREWVLPDVQPLRLLNIKSMAEIMDEHDEQQEQRHREQLAVVERLAVASETLFWKTFGGLTAAYYFRHFFFGLMFPVITYFSLADNLYPPPLIITCVFVAVNTLLYPYARFVYESVVNFVLGDSVFYINAGVHLLWKFLTMYCCWFLAMAIAPVGLLYLYIVHSKVE